jgi:peroxiredoxin
MIARGTALPSVSVARLDGTVTTLPAELAGRVAVVSLWATWCEACTKEFAALARLDAQLRSCGAVLVSISIGESPAAVAPLVRAQHFSQLELVDENFALADALGSRRVPMTLVVDRAGKVVYVGPALDADALAALRDTL